MKSLFLISISFLLLVSGIFFSYQSSNGILYKEYQKLWEYRTLHPDTLSSTKAIRLESAGHSTTYADALWMKLIQYIGDNIRNSEYQKFTNQIISRIIDLHPHFMKPYTIALLLAPSLDREKPEYREQKYLTEQAYAIGKIGMERNCDQKKLENIGKRAFGRELWDDASIKNPCTDAFVPYYMAITARELEKYEDARYYYKVAATHEDAPQASRFLGPLSIAEEGDHMKAAEIFLLVAISGYDEDPYICHTIASEVLTKMKSKPLIEFVDTLGGNEEKIPTPRDTTNPLANAGSTCQSSVIRAMKQIYLAYISMKAQGYPDAKTSKDLIASGALTTIPSIRDQKGWGVVKINNVWRYRQTEYIK